MGSNLLTTVEHCGGLPLMPISMDGIESRSAKHVSGVFGKSLY